MRLAEDDMLMTDEEANAAIAALPNEIRVSTHAFGPCIWRRVGSRAYVRKDGRHTTLFEWEAPCAFCSIPVQVIATVGQTTIAKNIRFDRPTCPRHRTTPKQSQLLAYERALGYGLLIFEDVRAQMLARDQEQQQQADKADANG
jgi:hypothetical protein